MARIASVVTVLFAILLSLSGRFAGPQDRAAPPAELTLETALAQLPPIEHQGTFDRDKGEWDFVPAVDWLTEYLAHGGTLTDEQWRQALLRSGAIRVRTRWPADLPLAVGIERPVWLGWLTEVRLTPTDSSLRPAKGGTMLPVSCGNCADGRRRRARYQELGRLAPGFHMLGFEVVVERGEARSVYEQRRNAAPPQGPAAVLWKGSLTFMVEVVSTLDDVLPGAHGDALDSAVRRAIDVDVFEGGDLVLRADVDRVPELATTAVSLEVQLCEGPLVRGQESRMILDRPGFIDQAVSFELASELTNTSEWTVRVRGVSNDVLHAWNAQRWWDGELVIALADVPRH